MTHPSREASRVLLIDPTGRLLLVRAGGWWFTIGGGIEPGESPEQAAVREVHEETGIVLTQADLGPVVFQRTLTVPWNGGLVEQHEEFRVALSPGVAVTTVGLEPYEQAALEGMRWWTADELQTTTERISPDCLPELLEQAAR